MKINVKQIQSLEIDEYGMIILKYKMPYTDDTKFSDLPPFCIDIDFGGERGASMFLGNIYNADKDFNGRKNIDRYIDFFSKNNTDKE